MKNLIAYAQRMIAKYPKLKYEIDDALSLAKSEIDSGESEENEISLAKDHIEEITGEADNANVSPALEEMRSRYLRGSRYS